MPRTKLIKNRWLRLALIITVFIGLIILISRAIIFSHPKPLRSYLEFLDKHAQRGLTVSVYSKEEFARKYLGLNNGQAYQPADFIRLFQEYFKCSPVKENNLFLVYKITDQTQPCRVDIFGLSKKKDLIYVSSRSTCSKNGDQNK